MDTTLLLARRALPAVALACAAVARRGVWQPFEHRRGQRGHGAAVR